MSHNAIPPGFHPAPCVMLRPPHATAVLGKTRLLQDLQVQDKCQVTSAQVRSWCFSRNPNCESLVINPSYIVSATNSIKVFVVGHGLIRGLKSVVPSSIHKSMSRLMSLFRHMKCKSSVTSPIHVPNVLFKSTVTILSHIFGHKFSFMSLVFDYKFKYSFEFQVQENAQIFSYKYQSKLKSLIKSTSHGSSLKSQINLMYLVFVYKSKSSLWSQVHDIVHIFCQKSKSRLKSLAASLFLSLWSSIISPSLVFNYKYKKMFKSLDTSTSQGSNL